MEFTILLLLIGGVFLTLGILEHKNVYSKKTYAEGTVVHYVSAQGSTLALTAVNHLVGAMNPVVRVETLAHGTMQLKLYEQVMPDLIREMPELQVGGKVSVMFFGDQPKVCHLVGHPLAQTALRFSMKLVIGAVCLGVAVILIAAMFLL